MLSSSLQIQVYDEQMMRDVGSRLAKVCTPPMVIYLEGDLGTGKTTFSRGFITGLGHSGKVKSPTYTLIEPYQMVDCQILHMDLYRLSDPEELYYLGVRDCLDHASMMLVEWPQRGIGVLPRADIIVLIQHQEAQRCLCLTAQTAVGEQCLNMLN